MSRRKEKNKFIPSLSSSNEVIESYVFAAGSRELSVYSERLLLRIIEVAQSYIRKMDLTGDNSNVISLNKFGRTQIEIPIKSITKDSSGTNYEVAKKAIKDLMTTTYGVERKKMVNDLPVVDENGEQEYEYIAHSILTDCEINVKPGVAVVTVNDFTWEAILNFSSGFRKYDLEAALSFGNKNSIRLFRLLGNVEGSITYSLKDLKQKWHLDENTYKRTQDFCRFIIEPAKKEIENNEKCAWYFTYSKEKVGGSKVINALTFSIHKKGGIVSSKNPKVAIADVLDETIQKELLKNFGFDKEGIQRNMVLFQQVSEKDVNIGAFLQKIKVEALKASNPAGYVINSLKNLLNELQSPAGESDSTPEEQSQEDLAKNGSTAAAFEASRCEYAKTPEPESGGEVQPDGRVKVDKFGFLLPADPETVVHKLSDNLKKQIGVQELEDLTVSKVREVCDWMYGSRRWLLLCGTPGNGKTSMLDAIYGLIMAGAVKKTSKSIETYFKDNKSLPETRKSDVLLVDDLGAESEMVNLYGEKHHPLAELLLSRYNSKQTTVITSNYTVEDLGKIYGSRVGDRLREMCKVIFYTEPSFRK